MLMKNSTSPSTVNAIAGFADRAVSTSLKPDVRKLYKRNILDSLGCAIAALPGAPFAALREQFAEYRSGGSCSLTVALVAPLSRQHLRKRLVADVDPRHRVGETFLCEGLAHPLGPVFVLGCRLGDDLFLVVDALDRLLEQAIGAQLNGDVVLALELGAIGAPAVDRAARGHARFAGDLVQRRTDRDALAHQLSDRGAEDVAGVRRRRVGQDLDPVGP